MTNTIKTLKEQLQIIRSIGFVKTKRAHDTGVGKTLEDLLGIKENNISLPDIGNIEIKAKRIDSASMLTLVTKSPEPSGANRILFEKYKYLDKNRHYNLHSTIYGSRKNSQSLQVVFENNRLVLKNRFNIKAFWPLPVFDDVLKAKSDKILLVFAESKGEKKTKQEKFHYTEAYLLSQLNTNKFKTAIEKDKLMIDIRIGVYRSGQNRGRYHDHGTAFRIRKKDFLQLFDNFQQLI